MIDVIYVNKVTIYPMMVKLVLNFQLMIVKFYHIILKLVINVMIHISLKVITQLVCYYLQIVLK